VRHHGTGSRALGFGLVAVVSAASLAACSPEAPANVSGSWTILTYSIADTDLEPYMMDDLGELGESGGYDDLNLLALVDRSTDYGTDDVLGLDGWDGGKLLEITSGGATELEDLGDINTGDPQVLADFITRGITDYPADHYALVISDHGASWPGVGGDESSDQDSLELWELNEAIAAGIAGGGIDKLDLIGFDACLMATYEVASTLAPLADRLLASQELEPGHGWDYSTFGMVGENGGATVDELGSAIIAGFQAQAVVEEDDSEITLSLTDLTAMPTVDAALADFTTQLIERVDGVAPTVGKTLAQTLGFGKSPDPDSDSFMTDLGILAGEIGVDAVDVSDAADALVRAINDAVVDKVDGLATQGATGLSIYFPPQPEYYVQDYDEIVTDGNWIAFLTAYYGAGDAIPSGDQPSSTGDADIQLTDDGLTITGDFGVPAENVAETYIRYGTAAEDGSITYLGKEQASIDESGTAVGTFDLTTMEITDGVDTVGAYLELTYVDDVTVFDVPMAYYPPGESTGFDDVLLSITLDDEWNVLSETYYSYDTELSTYGELTTDPAGLIVPQVLVVAADGTETWVATSDVGLYADLPSLQYSFPELPSGTELYIELWVVDFGGNAASVSGTITLP
jgi:hypothetical protein